MFCKKNAVSVKKRLHDIKKKKNLEFDMKKKLICKKKYRRGQKKKYVPERRRSHC